MSEIEENEMAKSKKTSKSKSLAGTAKVDAKNAVPDVVANIKNIVTDLNSVIVPAKIVESVAQNRERAIAAINRYADSVSRALTRIQRDSQKAEAKAKRDKAKADRVAKRKAKAQEKADKLRKQLADAEAQLKAIN
jgi:septal ring factor EnvC (AmiA/AmiB activator)